MIYIAVPLFVCQLAARTTVLELAGSFPLYAANYDSTLTKAGLSQVAVITNSYHELHSKLFMHSAIDNDCESLFCLLY